MEAQVDNVHLASVLRTSLNPVWVLRLTVILEDSLDQLSIVGSLMENGGDSPPKDGKDDHSSIGFRRRSTSQDNTNVTRNSRRLVSGGLSRLQQSSALKKWKAHRQFLWDVLEETRQELEMRGSFERLQRSSKDDEDLKNALCETISWEDETKERIKQLQLEMITLNQDTENKVQEYHELITDLKEQLQNLRTWTTTRSKYMQRKLELQVDEQRRWNLKLENEIQQNSENLQEEITQEIISSLDVQSFLNHKYAELEDKLEYWMDRHDNGIEEKQQEINNMKTTRANDRTKIQELAQKYNEYESVIIKHELMKEAERKMKEREEIEFKSIIKLQAWWRGVRVRKGMVVIAALSGRKAKESKGGKSKRKKK
uniref:dynein regulatory complex protein 9-like n=1 Tax=Myxine glutinosa TaxID=7769 RepID=UPI00358E6E0F